MNYRLVILTHGPSLTLRDTLASFGEFVEPEPSDVRIVYDGTWAGAAVLHGLSFPCSVTIHCADEQEGFCRATERAWCAASSEEPSVEYVFYLEHDFRFLRPVNLCELADALDDYPSLAQMALMRGPVNREEKRAGGVIGKHRARGDVFTGMGGHDEGAWIVHNAFFTTNPSLMTTRFMRENPWPAEESECEGRFGIALRERGYSFGIWGDGSSWVEHTGRRTGHGY